MQVPFGNLGLHYQQYKSHLDEAIHRVLESGHFILGKELEKFESDFAKFLNLSNSYVVGCASGTEAIYLALAAVGVGVNDEVLVVAHTAVPTISAISMSGATPVFVDIDPSTCLMDIDQLESKINEKTKAIIPVHLYGQMVRMDPIMKLASQHGLTVIEDAAQATGATINGIKAGTIGQFGAFSFYPSKNLGAFGDGGAVVAKGQENYERLIKLRNYGQSRRYYHDIVGINSRLDELQAAILSAQIPFVSDWNARRKAIANRYTQGLKDLMQTPQEIPNHEHVYHLYVVQLDNRELLQDHLTQHNIQTLVHYPIPAHLQLAYQYLGYKEGDLPNTERVARCILSLPIYPELTDSQIDYVIACIRQFYDREHTINRKPEFAQPKLDIANQSKSIR